jgi:mannose-6-phosphate isomerase class I
MKNLKLIPECKDNIWGGTKLKEKYGKISSAEIVAETWELSYHKDGPSRLEDGSLITESLTKEELGTNCDGFSFFPTLVKLIDARQDLSVQVHPSDAYALKNENSFGKTEMWYIVEAEEGAGIYLGFKNTVTAEEFEDALGRELSGSPQNWLGKRTFTPGDGVQTMVIGGITYTGTRLRELLKLNSTAFSMTVENGGITIETLGKGHRVGMSQYGADAMAQNGSTYSEILMYYYQGTRIDKMENIL